MSHPLKNEQKENSLLYKSEMIRYYTKNGFNLNGYENFITSLMRKDNCEDVLELVVKESALIFFLKGTDMNGKRVRVKSAQRCIDKHPLFIIGSVLENIEAFLKACTKALKEMKRHQGRLLEEGEVFELLSKGWKVEDMIAPYFYTIKGSEKNLKNFIDVDNFYGLLKDGIISTDLNGLEYFTNTIELNKKKLKIAMNKEFSSGEEK